MSSTEKPLSASGNECMVQPTHTENEKCTCAMCRLNVPFEMPDDIVDECLKGNIVLFAGAGVSTEDRMVLPQTFYEVICEALKIDSRTAGAFPDVMTRFAAQANGRRLLLRMIRDRVTYISAFGENQFTATRFHRELSTLHPLEHIITTNWDEYFERECGAASFITAEDFAFWDIPGRKVFKLHGSASNYGSVVATRADYESCYEKLSTGLLGSNLKMLLATKTVVYVGFSFLDDDFVRLHALLSKEMGGLRPQSYIVTLDQASDDRFRNHQLIPLYTDGTFFLKTLKARLVSERAMLPDTVYDDIEATIERRDNAQHDTLSINTHRYPEVIYSLFYQDGLRHALGRILTLRSTGYYSHVCNPRDVVTSYEKLRKTALREGRFGDAAYIDGYMNGHVFFLAPPEGRKKLPLFFLHGPRDTIASLTALKKHLRIGNELHRAASRSAARQVKKLPAGVVMHHKPCL